MTDQSGHNRTLYEVPQTSVPVTRFEVRGPDLPPPPRPPQPVHRAAPSAAPDPVMPPGDALAQAAIARPEPAPRPDPSPVPIPVDFGFEDEHPQIALPFALHMAGRRFEGRSLSVTHLIVTGDGQPPLPAGTQDVARLQVRFDGFDLTLAPVVAMAEAHADGTMVMRFPDPTGPHLPQLRYILNNAISGEMTTMNGLLSYTGPTAPKAPKPAAGPAPLKQRVRSIAILAASVLLVVAALASLYSRMSTAREMHPVFVEIDGQQMRATAPGQIGYLNPDALEGEVLFSLYSNAGDVLNFVLPCDCQVAISPEVNEGATVLPSDLILTIFRNTSEIRAKTMISVEGLARAMEGDSVFLDLNDGRSIPVEVVLNDSTRAAAFGGGMFVPVQLRAADGALTQADAGLTGRLRITSSVLARARLN